MDVVPLVGVGLRPKGLADGQCPQATDETAWLKSSSHVLPGPEMIPKVIERSSLSPHSAPYLAY